MIKIYNRIGSLFLLKNDTSMDLFYEDVTEMSETLDTLQWQNFDFVKSKDVLDYVSFIKLIFFLTFSTPEYRITRNILRDESHESK